MEINKIENKVTVSWRDDVKAVVDKWEDYSVSIDDFRQGVFIAGLDYAKANGGVAWIVDSSDAKGVFNQEIQKFIDSDVFPAYAKNGIKYFITILPTNAITKLTVKNFSRKVGPSGMELIEVASLDAAIDFLKNQ
jgi:hypothetical protein